MLFWKRNNGIVIKMPRSSSSHRKLELLHIKSHHMRASLRKHGLTIFTLKDLFSLLNSLWFLVYLNFFGEFIASLIFWHLLLRPTELWEHQINWILPNRLSTNYGDPITDSTRIRQFVGFQRMYRSIIRFPSK